MPRSCSVDEAISSFSTFDVSGYFQDVFKFRGAAASNGKARRRACQQRPCGQPAPVSRAVCRIVCPSTRGSSAPASIRLLTGLSDLSRTPLI